VSGHDGYSHGVLGLPDHITTCLFDLDGVLTQTAKVHNAAWKEMFDVYLRERAARRGEPFVPFDSGDDYNKYVDGRPRADGVRTFLSSRGIDLPQGTPEDPPSVETVNGLGNRKNEMVLQRIRDVGVEVYPGSVAYLRAARDLGLRRAVVSASANAAEVLEAAGIADLIEIRIDGKVAAEEGLRGKPHPDTFLAAAQRFGVDRHEAAVFEDATAGVQAGHDGGFGYVVGVDRVGQTDALRAHGASIVVLDLAELLDGAHS
jgi:beta-phosphoglucomutase family hydrolase